MRYRPAMLVDRVGLAPQEPSSRPLRPEFARLADELAALHMLGDVVRWAARQQPPRAILDVITQDEYTHDVVLHYRDDLHLVFDTT